MKFLITSVSMILLNACTQTETQYTTSATIFLINETNVVVKSDSTLNYVIQPGDTLIRKESYTNEYGEKPSINNYDPFVNISGSRVFVYGNNLECELGLTEIENYENRKEISELEFEFTFRFTENKRKNSEPCSL